MDHKASHIEDDDEDYDDEYEEEEPHHNWLGGSTAVKFLLAGGVAGAGTSMLPNSPNATDGI